MRRPTARPATSRATSRRRGPIATGQTATVTVGGVSVTGLVSVDSVGTPSVEARLRDGKLVRVALGNQVEEEA